MSHNAFACIASLFKAGFDSRAWCSDGGEQDKSYAGKTRGKNEGDWRESEGTSLLPL